MIPQAISPAYEILLELVVKGALLMTVAFAITFAFKRASAALRHAVWSLAFVGLLLLPFCAVVLPTWPVSIPGLHPPAHISADNAAFSSVDEATPSEAATATTAQFEPENAAAQVNPSNAAAQIATGSPDSTAIPWTEVALLVWMAGAIALLLKLALVLGKLSLLRRLAEPVLNPKWKARADALSESLGIRRPIRLLRHDEVVVPMTYGVRRPVILLPMQADGWTEEEIRVTLMHELLHVKRCDHLVHILALSARALHWFNPLTWAATKRLVIERERACDDGVISMGVASTSYADHLLGIARDVLSGREASTAALAMARPSELRTRIVAILDPAQPRRTLTRIRMLGMTGCAGLLVLSLAAMQPGGTDRTNVETQPIALTLESGDDVIEIVDAEQMDGLTEESAEPIREDDENEVDSGLITTAENVGPNQSEQPADTSEVETQRRALFAISQLPDEQGVALLTEVAKTHRNPELREEAVFWLGQMEGESVDELLESFALNDASLNVQKKAIFALSELDDRRGIPRLMNLARSHSNVELRADAVFWLGEGGGADVAEALETFARSDASQAVQKKAIFALAQIDEHAGVPHLMDLAKTHSDPAMRGDAIFWLGETGDPRAADMLMDIVNGN